MTASKTPNRPARRRRPIPKVTSEADPTFDDGVAEAITNPAPKKGSDLLKRTFPKLDWIVPGMVPDGCHLLIAAPKIGKSLLTLDLAIACAEGGKALGVLKVRQRPVLVLDLESGERRLQNRLASLLGDRALSDAFEYHTDPDTALAVLHTFLERHKGRSPLVILDTLSGVMGSRPRDMTQFQHEKTTLQPLQKLCADDPGASIIVVHHNRKSKEGDSVDASSGTHGLTAAVDGIIALNRPERREPAATLICELRDVEGDEYAILLGVDGWALDGRTLEEARRNAMERHRQEKVAKQGDLGTELMDLLRLHGPMTPAVAFEVYSRDPKATATKQGIRNALSRLHRRELVSKDDAGRYAPMGVTPELPELRVDPARAGNPPDVSTSDVCDVGANPTQATQGTSTKRTTRRRRR
ncbi:AAA family ATPase [Microbacterium koreense]|uniref:AAA family ATPase n=1 Tax=Microbacterium koreense TaxID=323761 RepID=A0ABW2ZR30_9MICO